MSSIIGGDRFELLKALGSGGSGTVFEARERATGARVALKVLNEPTGWSVLHFKSEFRALAELSHPNVVRFGSLYEEAGHFYFTMELLEGETFIEHVRKRAPGMGERLDVSRLRAALAQLAGGLVALHAAGLVHRDVKPQNILVTGTGRVVLLDFGLATTVEDNHKRELAGTLDYMAPEQVMGRELTPAADWYAVGALLFEALTGSSPHAGRRFRNILEEARHGPPSPSSMGGALPSDLCALCSGLLRFRPVERLDETTIASYLGINAENERGRASFRSRAHFVGGAFVARATELETLGRTLERARDGDFTVVRVEGESGMGKSALVRRFLASLGREDGDAVVLSSRSYEREAVPYRGMDSVIDALVWHLEAATRDGESLAVPPAVECLARLFPVVRALPGFDVGAGIGALESDLHEARQKAFQALRSLFRWLAERRTIIVHLDDAQWIDAESVALLSFLAKDRAPHTLFLLASRPTARDPLAGLALDDHDVSRVTLKPLSLQESEQLASLLMGSLPSVMEGKAARLAVLSGGHPLFLQELVAHARRNDRAADSLHGALANRLESLDDGARRLLGFVATAAAPLKHAVAQEASSLSTEVYTWALDTLRGENLVSFNAKSATDDVHVYHDFVREHVTEAMGAAAQRSTHGLLALAIEKHASEDLDALAHHFARAEEAERARHYALEAGDRALHALAFERATQLFQLGLRFEDRPEERGHLETRLGQSLSSSGHGTDAADAYLRAAPLVLANSVELRRRAGEQMLRAGHVATGTDILSGILRELGLSVPTGGFAVLSSLVWTLIKIEARGLQVRESEGPITPRGRLRLDACWTVATGLSVVHHLRATEFQARALLLALDAGDTDRVVKSAALLGATLSMSDGIGRRIAKQLRARASELAGPSPSDENAAWLDLANGIAHMGHWDFAACERLCSRAEVALKKQPQGAAWEIATSQAFVLWSAAFRGNFRLAKDRVPDLLASAKSRGDRHAESAMILSPLHLVGLAADEPARVREECELCLVGWPAEIAPFQHMCGAYILAHVDLYEDRAEHAWGHIRHAFSMLKRSHLSRVEFQRIDLLGLRARGALALAAADRGAARLRWQKYVNGDVLRLRRESIPAAHALADMVEGATFCLDGRVDECLQRFARASHAFDALGMRLHSTISALAHGLVSGDGPSRGAAERALAEVGVVNARGMLRVWVPGVMSQDSLAVKRYLFEGQTT